MQCSVPCMPVESKAGNRVTWNHFLFCPYLLLLITLLAHKFAPDWKHNNLALTFGITVTYCLPYRSLTVAAQYGASFRPATVRER